MKRFVSLFGVALATSSFDAIVQEVLTCPVVPDDLSVDYFTSVLDARLTRLVYGYQDTVHSGMTQRDQLDALRRLRTSTEQRMRKTYNQVIRTIQDMDSLKRMSRSTAQVRFERAKKRRIILDEAYHENVSEVEDEVIVENMLRLIGVSNYWEDFVMPTPSNDLEETVWIFEDSNKMLPTNALMMERIENVEVVSIRYLTWINLQYLRIRIRLLLENRQDLLTRLETTRNDFAKRLMGTAEEGRIESDKSNAQYALEDFKFAANEVAERSIQGAYHAELPDSFFEEKIAQGIEDLDRLTREASELVDAKILIPIRAEAEQQLVHGYTSLHEHVREVRDPDAYAAMLASLTSDEDDNVEELVLRED